MQHGALGWVVLGCIAPDCEYSEIVVEALADGGHVKNVPRYFCSSSWYALLADTCFEAMFHDRSMSPDSRACVPLHVNSNAMRQECALNRRMQHSVCCAALPVVCGSVASHGACFGVAFSRMLCSKTVATVSAPCATAARSTAQTPSARRRGPAPAAVVPRVRQRARRVSHRTSYAASGVVPRMP